MFPFVVVVRRCCLLVRVVDWLLLLLVASRCSYVRSFVISRRAYLLFVFYDPGVRRC